MSKSIIHLNFSRAGGAGAVARLLHEEQRAQGLDSQFHYVIDKDLRSQPLSAPLHTAAAGLDDAMIRNPSFNAPISLLRDKTQGPSASDIQRADIVHLHGINGALPGRFIEQLSEHQRVVWTLHDMNPFTGACHYSLGCDKFQRDCGACPAVRKPFQSLVSTNLKRKRKFVDALPHLRLVAPSQWLADQASGSAILGGRTVSVQENPINPAFFAERVPPKNLDSEAKTFVVVAKNLDDPVKNVSLAVQAFHEEFDTSEKTQMILIGAGGQGFASESVMVRGPQSAEKLRGTLASATALIVPSLAENSPLVVPEAAAAGCLALVAQAGGMPELVETVGQGHVFGDKGQLRQAMRDSVVPRANQSQAAKKRLAATAKTVFSPTAAVAGYAKVYSG